MTRIVAGMKKQFVKEFVAWMDENGIKICGEPFESFGIWHVAYMPIGREQKQKCERYIEYRCINDLM